MWWNGDRRPPALTADTGLGVGLQGSNDGNDQLANGDAIPAPLARSEPDQVSPFLLAILVEYST